MLPLLILFTLIFFPVDRVQSRCVNSSCSNAARYAPPAALYILGDSLVDSGNNNLLPTLARANFFPYGSDFPGGPTGRFTNGRTVVDFIAEFLDLPYAPPYVSLRTDLAPTQATGLNYASASCGILPETGKNLGQCLSLAEQIDLLQLTIDFELPKYLDTKSGISNHLSRSLFVISVGSNDYLINYLRPLSATRALYSPRFFAHRLITSLSQQLQKLYQMGARKMLVFELGPLGCIPSVTRNIQINGQGQCVEEVNHFASLYNHLLSEMFKDLSSSLPDSTLILGRVFGLAYDAIKNPSAYGFRDATNACCITWVNGTSACIPGFQPCDDPFQHYFWDGFHLTEAVYRIVAERCINDSSICSPRSIKELLN